jgi:UDP-glucose:(heptosyl)LPS alpha-1,3-glucosyltransferase
MKLAFVLYIYVPYGGLQKDFLKIASECHSRGHDVSVYTMGWEGTIPPGFNVKIIPPRGFSSHRRCKNFSDQVGDLGLKDQHDLVIGFNKVRGLDVYFASDPCYVARALANRSFLYRWSLRFRIYSGLEAEVFKSGTGTRVLLLNPHEQEKFMLIYHTEPERFHVMPPGIKQHPLDPIADANTRKRMRYSLELSEGHRLLLMVGSGFHTKGVDRAISVLADLPPELGPSCRLVILGQGNSRPLMRLAKKLGVADRVAFLGVKADVSSYYLAADILLHPARTEAAGMVLVEALTHGLPVLVTDVCGYAFHVERAAAGRLLPSPFDKGQFSAMLTEMLTSNENPAWRANGLNYAARTDLYSLPQKAADFFEQMKACRDEYA